MTYNQIRTQTIVYSMIGCRGFYVLASVQLRDQVRLRSIFGGLVIHSLVAVFPLHVIIEFIIVSTYEYSI